MLFNSIDFLLFLPIVLFVVFTVPQKLRWVWLLIVSSYFYMQWNAKYIVLIWFSIVVTYTGSMLISKIKTKVGFNNSVAKIVLWGVILSNLGVLFFFKYFNFFIENVNALTGLSFSGLRFALPVGISFYTFQAISYTIDVYMGTVAVEKNIFRYGLFVSFFPQLVAGPIERTENLLPQLKNIQNFNYDNMRKGALLIGWGFFQKLVIADRIAIGIDGMYIEPSQQPGIFLAIATLLYYFQIYCDFASYSNIARGTAKIIGIDLMKNFNAPFLATNMPKFWARWHISLSKWFEDYVYMPFVFTSKNKVISTYLGFLLVFLMSGIWHGAAWTFVFWGGIHAFYQIFGALTRKKRAKLYKKIGVNTKSEFYINGQRLVTFVLVVISLIFFRASTLEDSFVIIKNIIFNFNASSFNWDIFQSLFFEYKELLVLIVSLFVLIFVEVKSQTKDIREIIMNSSFLVRWSVYIIGIMGIVIFGIYGPLYDSAPFIYFQF